MGYLRLLYPLLFAALPPLRLAVYNPGWVEAGDLLAVLGVALGASAALYALLLLTARLLPWPASAELAALAVLGLLIGFYYYRMGYAAASRLAPGPPAHVVVAAGGFATLAGALAFLARRPGLLDRLTEYLALSGTILLAWLGGSAALNYLRGHVAVRQSRIVAELAASVPEAAPAAAEQRRSQVRDIYLIILDEHANSTVLQEQLGFDNREFERRLRALGLTVPHVVRSNYLQTTLSIPSLLNFAHLTGLEAELGPQAIDPSVPNRLVQVNRAARFLKREGYRIVHIPSHWWPATRRLELADVEVNLWPGTSLSRALTRTDFRRRLRDRSPLSFTELGGPAEYADYLRRTFTALAGMPAEPGPKLVLAHVLSPHWPQVLDRHCRLRAPRRRHGHRVEGAGDPQPYLEQLQCVDRMVLDLVRVLLERSSVPPIILLQSDHGTTFTEERAPEHAWERSGAFGAYYLPEGGGRLFADSVSLVNVFPKVFNYYFRADLPLEPDAVYLSLERTPYAFEQADRRRLDPFCSTPPECPGCRGR